jgi:hypothetical protein
MIIIIKGTSNNIVNQMTISVLKVVNSVLEKYLQINNYHFCIESRK